MKEYFRSMLSRNLEETLHRALALTAEYHHEYATLEHLLLSLTEDQDSVAVLRACGVDIKILCGELKKFLENELNEILDEKVTEPKPTASFQRVIQRAVIHVQSSGREEVTGANVLVALFSERESHAVYFLQTQEMSRLDAVNYISHGMAKVSGLSRNETVNDGDEDFQNEGFSNKGA